MNKSSMAVPRAKGINRWKANSQFFSQVLPFLEYTTLCILFTIVNRYTKLQYENPDLSVCRIFAPYCSRRPVTYSRIPCTSKKHLLFDLSQKKTRFVAALLNQFDEYVAFRM